MNAYPAQYAAGGVNIEAWTAETIQSMSTLQISAATVPGAVRGATVTLEIPLDEELPSRTRQATGAEAAGLAARANYKRREPIRRDSLKRREALLRGKEGSRRRQKWENDHLLGNPWAEPPEPSDWEIRPTYPVQTVPYFLAPIWDERQAEARRRAANAPKAMPDDPSGKIPKDLRQKLKKAKGAKSLLQDLEEEVRGFVQKWEAKEAQLRSEGLADVDSSEDEEIVFVGRNGQTRERQAEKKAEEKLARDKLVFDSLVDDHGAAFGRWLVHSIATYYNLRTWSVTTGNPARREAYVGIKDTPLNSRTSNASQLPRPLWVLI